MKKLSLLLVVSLVAMFSVGCNLTTQQKLDLAATATQVGCKTLASTAVPSVMPKATAKQVLQVLTDIQPYVNGLTKSNDIVTVLMPLAQIEVQKYITDPDQQEIALSAIEGGLMFAKTYLDSNPDIANIQGAVTKIANAAITGTISGLNAGIAKPDNAKLVKLVQEGSSTTDEEVTLNVNYHLIYYA